MDDPDGKGVKTMKDLLFSAGLKQHVSEMTHKGGHVLDLFITRDSLDTVSDVCIARDLPSDHHAVMGDIYISRPPPTRRSIKSRQLRAIDSTIFRDEVVSSLTMLSDNTPDDVNVMVNSFNDTLSNLLDKLNMLPSRPARSRYVRKLLGILILFEHQREKRENLSASGKNLN